MSVRHYNSLHMCLHAEFQTGVLRQGIFPFISLMDFVGLKPNSCQLSSKEFRFLILSAIYLKVEMRDIKSYTVGVLNHVHTVFQPGMFYTCISYYILLECVCTNEKKKKPTLFHLSFQPTCP